MGKFRVSPIKSSLYGNPDAKLDKRNAPDDQETNGDTHLHIPMNSPSFAFDVWVAALDSGYAPHAVFVAWADRRIEIDAHQPRWVLDLSLSRDADEAQRILRNEWSRRVELPSADVPTLQEPVSLNLGFLFLAFAAGRLPMEKLLLEAGQYADACCNYDVPACETFYLLLNEIDGGGPIEGSDRPLVERVAELFAPMAAKAQSGLQHLPLSAATE